MNTVVFVMVMFGYGSNINTGPEFSTLEKCQHAAELITNTANAQLRIGTIRTPWCVRIVK